MPLGKWAALVFLVIVLSFSLQGFFPLFAGPKTTEAFSLFIGLARAEDIRGLQSQRQDSSQLPESVAESAVQQAPPVSPDPPKLSSPDQPAEAEARWPDGNIVDTVHGEISRRLLASAEWLDSFFEDKRTLREANQSYLRVRYEFFKEKNTPQDLTPSFSLRLRLPKLQRKTHLVFESESAAEADNAIDLERTTVTEREQAEKRRVSAAINFIPRLTDKESFLIRSGAQLSQGKPVAFIGPRYRSLKPFETWNFRFTQEVIYRTDTRWQAETLLDFERQLPYDLFLRAFIDGVWLENTYGYFYSLNCSILQPLALTHAVQYRWSNNFVTRPSHELSSIDLTIQYRHTLWRKWLFFELIPQCRFPRDRNFEATPGIKIRLEMFFQ